MREDMSKVVTERPRVGHSEPSVKTGRRIHRYDENDEYEDLPKREKYSMKRQAGRTRGKHFSDLINPLLRYLRSNVGRPWDKVYSEMSEHLDFRKTTGRHIFEHVQQAVELHCYIGEDGKIYDQPCWKTPCLVQGLYVHPRTRLLCWKGRESCPKEQRAQIAAQPVTCIPITDNQYHIQLKGIWYAATLEHSSRNREELQAAGCAKPELFECFAYNPTSKLTRYWRGMADIRRYWILSKRQLSAKELKAAKLSNEAA